MIGYEARLAILKKTKYIDNSIIWVNDKYKGFLVSKFELKMVSKYNKWWFG